MFVSTLFYQILFFFTVNAVKKCQSAGHQQDNETPVPSEVIHHVPQHDICQQSRSKEITEKPVSPAAVPAAFWGAKSKACTPDQHHRPVNQEPNSDQTYTVHHQIMFRLPVNKHEQGHQYHVNHRRDRPSSLEHVVTHDTADNRAGNGRDLVSRINPAYRPAIVPFHVLSGKSAPSQAPRISPNR